MSLPPKNPPIHCAAVICFRGEDVLLIRRGTAPRKGEWSIPGGRIEPGEREQDAALRELLEETGITAILGPKIETIPAHFEGKDYMLHDYAGIWQSGEPRAGDDADFAGFVPMDKLAGTPMWPKTREVILKAYNQLKFIDAKPREES